MNKPAQEPQENKCDDPTCPWFEDYEDECPCQCHDWNAHKRVRHSPRNRVFMRPPAVVLGDAADD